MTGHGRDILNMAYFNPSTPDDERLPLPKRALLRIHKILSLPLYFLSIEREIQEGWPPVKRGIYAIHQPRTAILQNRSDNIGIHWDIPPPMCFPCHPFLDATCPVQVCHGKEVSLQQTFSFIRAMS